MAPLRPSLDFPSSPSSAWSYTQDHLSPLTPHSDFSPAPAIVSPDEFSLHVDLQPDRAVDVKASDDDMGGLRVFAADDRTHTRFESSPPRLPHTAYRVPPASHDRASDDFSWEATHSTPVDPSEPFDASRCSILIREVSLLVGMTGDDTAPADARSSTFEASQPADILPLNITPTRSLAARKRRNASLPNATSSSSIYAASPHSEKPLPVAFNPGMPVARHKSADAVRPSLSARRRQGQVFDFQPSPSPSFASRRNAIHLDETFTRPRDPPKPPSIPPDNRFSSLDRLECSLRKLEAYAPRNHRKSQSEGQPPDPVTLRKEKRPSLPPPRRLRKPQSTQEVTPRNPLHTVHGYHLSDPLPPVSRLVPPHRLVIPPTCSSVVLDEEHHEGDITPSSFMDMDLPRTEETQLKRQSSLKGKQKMKGLVNVAKRVSRGVIAWGKGLTGFTKHAVAGHDTIMAD